jgi:hypothetical protein
MTDLAPMSDTASTKHLEMLQAAIARMASHSFVAKGWSVTLATAMLGLAAIRSSRSRTSRTLA